MTGLDMNIFSVDYLFNWKLFFLNFQIIKLGHGSHSDDNKLQKFEYWMQLIETFFILLNESEYGTFKCFCRKLRKSVGAHKKRHKTLV